MEPSSNIFFTEAAFERYSVQPTFQELLEKYAPHQAKQAESAAHKHSKDEKRLTEPNTKKNVPYQPLKFLKGGVKCNFPRYSSLTYDQHQKYLNYEVKYNQQSLKGRHTAQQMHELREFRQYQTSVANEQREFQQFAERIARNCRDEYEFLHPLAKAFIENTINQWHERLQSQPQNYALYQTVGMSVEPVIPSDPVLKHLACLLSLGQAPAMKIEALNSQDPPVLHHMVSVKEGANKGSLEDSMTIISEDVNAKKLAEKHHANIVVSFSALVVLLDTHPQLFEQQWEIPITVSKTGDGETASSRIIYIDKPLKQKITFPHEGSKIFHQAVLKQFLSVNPKSAVEVDSRDERVEMFLQSGVDFNASSKKHGGGLDFKNTPDADALLELETFGSGLILPFPKRTSQCKEKTVLTKPQCQEEIIKNNSPKTSSAPPSNISSQCIGSNEVCEVLMKDESNNQVFTDRTCASNGGTSVPGSIGVLSEKKSSLESVQSTLKESNAVEVACTSVINKLSKDDSKKSEKLDDSDVSLPPAEQNELHAATYFSSKPAQSVEESEKSSDVKGDRGEEDAVRDSPQSPSSEDTGDRTLQVKTDRTEAVTESACKETPGEEDVVGDSPQSPSHEDTGDGTLQVEASRTESVTESSSKETPGKDYVVGNSSQSPSPEETGDRTLQVEASRTEAVTENTYKETPGEEDVVGDSPQSPSLEDTGDRTLQVEASRTESVTESACKKTPESPVKSLHDENIQDRQQNQMLKDDSRVSPLSKNYASLGKDSSASELEGELIIASPIRTDVSKEERTNQFNPSGKTEKSSNIGDEMASSSSKTSARTKRSKRLHKSIVGDTSEDEDEDSGVITRRRSARLRQMDAFPPGPTIAKKVKKKDNENDLPKGTEKEESDTIKDKTKGAETADMNEKDNVDTVQVTSVSEKLNVEKTKMDTKDIDVKIVQSSEDSKSDTVSNSTKPVALKRTGTSIVTNTTKKPKIRNMLKNQSAKNGKDGGVSSTIDTIMKLQEALHTRRQQRVVPNATPTSSQMQTSESKGEPRQNPSYQMPENPDDYLPPIDGNVAYNLWKLGKMNVLIRTRDEGVVSQGDAAYHQSYPVAVMAKMEYQTNFGFEQAGLSELCQIWSNLFIRPGSKVIRGRIDAMTSQLLKLDQLDLNNPLWGQCPLNPARSMKMVHAIFDKLQGLPTGRYLLSHNSGDSHASVHLALDPGSKKRVTYDLHTAHKQSSLQSTLPKVLPWIPLDPNVPTQKNVEQKTIPLTFPPRMPGMKLEAAANSGKKNKKKKKKKNNPKKWGPL